MVGIYKNSKFPLHHSYADQKLHTIQFSGNISGLYVNNLDENGIHEQLVSAYVGTSISKIETSCFANCTSLTAINSDNHIKKISDYAFYNCSSLEEVNFLGAEEKPLYNIGNYAFSGSGLKDIKINLKSSVSDSSINSYAFANCKQLKSVEFVDAPYLGPHMFDGCSKLQTVVFTDKHNYTYPYCFANCTSLKSITLPANSYSLASHMFDGCTNLKEVKFASGSILNYVEDHVFANCPSLTSITLPESVNSLSVIDGEFLAGSSVEKIIFEGILSGQIADAIEKKTTVTNYSTSKWYTDPSDIKTIYAEAKSKHIPILWYLSDTGASCGHCGNWHSIIEKSEFKNWVANECNFFLLGGTAYVSSASQSAARSIWTEQQKIFGSSGNTYVIGGMWWNKPNDDGSDGKDYGFCKSTMELSLNSVSAVKNAAKKYFTDNGWEGAGTQEIEIVIKEEITTFGLGSGKTLTIVDSSGNEYECTNDTVATAAEYRVDKNTTDNFKFGIWYYNARELKAFADLHNLPVFVERSSKGCEPCIDFRNNTWRNKTFQETIKSKPCLLCRVETNGASSFDTPNSEEYFVAHNWGNPNTYIPEIIYYWKKSDSSTYYVDWNYNYRTDSANANYQTVLNRLDEMLGSYTGDDEYVAPAIHSCNNGQCQYYYNEEDDTNGRYFICDHRSYRSSYSGSLTIDPAETDQELKYSTSTSKALFGQTLTSLVVGQTTSLPAYTYQYFTSFAEAFYDQCGLIFKVEKNSSNQSVVTYIYDFTNDEASNETIVDTGKFQTGTLYSLTDSTATTGFSEIVDYGGRTPTKLIVMFKVQSTDTSLENLIANSSFSSWMRKSAYLFIKVKSASWASNAPQELCSLENQVSFEGDMKDDSQSKILVLKQCLDCVATPNGYIGEVNLAKAIYYDSSKDVSYYTVLIDSYNI